MDGNGQDMMSAGDAVAHFSGLRSVAATARRALPQTRRRPKPSLEKVLLAHGAVTAAQLSAARKARLTLPHPLGRILLAQGAVNEVDLMAASAEHYRLGISDLTDPAPDRALASLLAAETAIALEAVPWRRMGSTLVIATAQPEALSDLRKALPQDKHVIFTLASRSQILAAQVSLYGEALARRAEARAPQTESCRTWQPARAQRLLTIVALGLAGVGLVAPLLATAVLFTLALLVFLSNMTLKTASFMSAARADQGKADAPHEHARAAHLRLPVVTILVPLLREREIAATLIENLSKLDYPAERLDVILVIEAHDDTTRQAIDRCGLPPWMRFVTVPPGHPQTKPRALNFALNFARGSIIGIYDAEDRPEPDQISRVVGRFAELPPEVACLQGRLDYFNSTHNAIARCFTIEYANWFRVLLPGVQRLGLFVPLGGTTLFIRRDVLCALGAWDAHNVTEDAELGLRLVRNGYRVEIVESTTFEEANAAILPWIAQRSRWQKGYLMTWATAMRQPARLWRDLGAWRFVGFQVQVLGAVTGFLAAPLIWTLMVIPFGVPHPLSQILSPLQIGLLGVLLVSALLLSLALSWYATRAAHLRGNRPWILMLELYQMLATLAAFRAATEMLIKPFFWAKTTHGSFGGAAQEAQDPDSAKP